jgi:two-component system phosphate regulon sensor histidine kinase PhoR
VLLINRAAGQILKVTPSDVIGKPFHEVIRVAEVLETVEDSLQRAEMLERDIELATAKDTKYLQIHTSPLRLAGGGRFGVVMVFSDVSRLRELEGMRRNFVANVSHELRTPLTSIQGFAETLMNPAVSDPTEIKKFLQIIQRHAARLGRIIEDILTLSRIERDVEGSQIDLKIERLKPTLQAALELCQVKAEKKRIPLDLVCPDDLKVAMDPYLMEQAIVNLIDNAIRYSDEGKPIHVSAERQGNEVLIKIKDNGVGIPEKEVGRIFERFYRIDKARSRELGGTGLGLSIVKHISLAHKGRVEVASQVGQGSQFTIHLPAA